jgi:hypothetical protein
MAAICGDARCGGVLAGEVANELLKFDANVIL